MDEISVIACKQDDNFVVIASGNYETLSNIFKVIEEDFNNAKLITLNTDEYTSKMDDLQNLNELIASKF